MQKPLKQLHQKKKKKKNQYKYTMNIIPWLLGII